METFYVWLFCAFGAEYMLYVGHSTPGEQSWGQMVGDSKAYRQFTGNVKLINELKLKKSIGIKKGCDLTNITSELQKGPICASTAGVSMCIKFIPCNVSHLSVMLHRVMRPGFANMPRVDKIETRHCLELFLFHCLFLEMMKVGSTRMRNITSGPRSQLQLEP